MLLRVAAITGDRFIVRQLIRPMVNLYEVFAAGDGAEPGRRLAFVRQKRLAVKEDIRAFADDSETDEVFRIKARSVFEVAGRYDVHADDAHIGTLEKVFGKSLLRSTWRVLSPDGAELMTATESSMPVALLRRAIDLVPYGALVPIPYHFTLARSGQRVGALRRVLRVRDEYELDLAGDAQGHVDRGLAVALAIGLDALQSR